MRAGDVERGSGRSPATKRRVLEAWLAVAVTSLAVSTDASAAGFDGQRYWQAVQRYAQGDRAAADLALGEWDPKVFKELAKGVDGWARKAARCDDCETRTNLLAHPLLAAALLHTERAWSPGEPPRHAELELAYSLLKAAALAPDAPSLVRPWLLATTLSAHAAADGSLALRWAVEATSRFPDDAELLLAHGAVEEALCGFSSLGPQKPLEVPEVARAHLLKARRLFDGAIRHRPDLSAARLRRGRVRALLGEGGAEDDLRAVALGAGEPRLVYLARLFLGRLAEVRGRSAAAVAEYRAAGAAFPGRTAHLALSHALSVDGSPSLPRGELARAVEDRPRARADPYREYPWPPGRARASQPLLDQLRAQLR